MNKLQQNDSALSGIWMWAGNFFLCFGFFFWVSDASFASAKQVLIVAGSAIIYVGLFNFIRFLCRSPAISRLPRSIFVIVGLILAAIVGYAMGFFSAPIRKALPISPVLYDTVTGCLQFLIVLAVSGTFNRHPGRTVNQAPNRTQE